MAKASPNSLIRATYATMKLDFIVNFTQLWEKSRETTESKLLLN